MNKLTCFFIAFFLNCLDTICHSFVGHILFLSCFSYSASKLTIDYHVLKISIFIICHGSILSSSTTFRSFFKISCCCQLSSFDSFSTCFTCYGLLCSGLFGHNSTINISFFKGLSHANSFRLSILCHHFCLVFCRFFLAHVTSSLFHFGIKSSVSL